MISVWVTLQSHPPPMGQKGVWGQQPTSCRAEILRQDSRDPVARKGREVQQTGGHVVGSDVATALLHPLVADLVTTMSFIMEAVGHVIRNRMQDPKDRDRWWNEHMEKTELTRKRWWASSPLQKPPGSCTEHQAPPRHHSRPFATDSDDVSICNMQARCH